jgi:hypothetical protein
MLSYFIDKRNQKFTPWGCQGEPVIEDALHDVFDDTTAEFERLGVRLLVTVTKRPGMLSQTIQTRRSGSGLIAA